MEIWLQDIEKTTLENQNFRTVVYTGTHTQLTLMRLKPGEDIGWETHGNLDQFLRLEQGQGRLELGQCEGAVDESHVVTGDWAFIIPAGMWHNVVNVGEDDLKLYSLYSPPDHADGTVHETKTEAVAAHH